MTRPATPYPTGASQPPVGDTSVGQLIGELASDLSTLLRQEIELAKTELKVEVSKAGKGAGLVGGAGYAGLMVGVFASLTLMFVLDLGMPTWVAALLVTIAWAIAGYVLFTRGRQQMKSVHPTPTQTVESIKETF